MSPANFPVRLSTAFWSPASLPFRRILWVCCLRALPFVVDHSVMPFHSPLFPSRLPTLAINPSRNVGGFLLSGACWTARIVNANCECRVCVLFSGMGSELRVLHCAEGISSCTPSVPLDKLQVCLMCGRQGPMPWTAGFEAGCDDVWD
jgi:hypothetical protein